MKLYYAPNTISIVVAITLHEAGLDYDPVLVDFAKREQAEPEFVAINPKARVPALVTPQGVLTETGALQDYIAAIAPEAGLVPADPVQAARMREVMYYLASTMHVNHAHRMRGSRWATQESSFADMQAKVPETMNASCAYIEAHGLEGPYVLGTQFSLADPYLYVVSAWLKGDGVEISDYPKLAAFRAAMRTRPSVQHVLDAGMLVDS